MLDSLIPFITKANPNQCRIPSGSRRGGQFTPCSGASSGGVTVVSHRAFHGEPIATHNKMSKLEVGAIGEKLVTEWLKMEGKRDARSLNVKVNNFPVDLIQNHHVIEVKAGLISNQKGTQHWRATIGQPGKKETEWLKTASKEKKAAWNAKKQQQIIDRKNAAVQKIGQDLGKKVKGYTYTVILNPDTKRADLFRFEGFHSSIRWNSPQAKSGYIGTVKYGD